jgi:hypothetical protein
MGRTRDVEIDANITVEIDIDNGQIEACLVDGIDYLNSTVEEMMIAALGGAYKFQQRICNFLDDVEVDHND